MRIPIFIFILIAFTLHGYGQADSCVGLGKSPGSAFPICGATTFVQDTVPVCWGSLPLPTYPSDCGHLTPINPYWYKFTCFSSGTLGFIIKPKQVGEDYDWQLFDVTGHDPSEVFTDSSLTVMFSWCGTIADSSFTGASDTAMGSGNFSCSSAIAELVSPFTTMPDLITGHNYLLVVSHFLFPTTLNTTGYSLSFGGGTAVINDPLAPKILSASASCASDQLMIRLNKQMKCSSIATNGSDFAINVSGITVIAAASAECTSNFDTDSLQLTLSNPLPTGTYKLIVQNGSDGNTLLDHCDSGIPEGDTVSFNVLGDPAADFNFFGQHCVGNAITFTDASSPAADLVNWHWNMGDGTVFDLSNGSPFTHDYLTAGPFTISLQITNSKGCVSTVFTRTITINVLPSAIISGTTTVCQNSMPTDIIFTGSGGTAPYTFNYSINNLPQIPVQSDAVGNFVIIVPTTVSGTFIYEITSVQETGAELCLKNLSNVMATVTVSALPAATISGSTWVCLNSTSPNIVFTGHGGTAPYTFEYTLNGSPLSISTTATNNTATIVAPTNIGGTYDYVLQQVTEGSSIACTQLQNDTASVTVSILPMPKFSYAVPVCDTKSIAFSDISVPNEGTITNWNWNFGDPLSGSNNTSGQPSPTHIFSAAGTYTVSLNVATDKGCTATIAFTKQVIVNDQPKAGFVIPEVCLNDSYATFIDTSAIPLPGNLSWLWNFGDANATPANPNTSILQHPKHSFTAAGNYVVTLAVTSIEGCMSEIKHDVFVNGSFPKAVFNVANESTPLCVNKPVSITNSSTVFPGTITKLEIFWDDANAPTVKQTDDDPFTGSVYTHLYPDFNSPATKTVNIHVRAYSGIVCTSDSVHAIILHASPKLKFNAIPDTCLLAAPFKLNQAAETAGVPGNPLFSGIGVSSTGIFSPQIAGVGTHTIMYTYTSDAGCVESISNTIKVLDTVAAGFSCVMPACDKAQIIFNDESIIPAGVVPQNTVWDFADGSAIETHIAGIPFIHVFPTWKTYHVKMFCTSAYGCSSTVFTKDVIVHPTPKAAFSFPASKCLPDGNVLFENKSTIDDGTENAFTYLWKFGDITSGMNDSAVAKNATHNYTSTGPFNVNLQVTSGAGCIYDTTILLDIIHPQPKADFISNRKTACLGEDIIFTNRTDPLQGTIAAINWDMGDNVNTALHTPIVDYTYLDTLTYKVRLYIINTIGCNSDTMVKEIKVYPNPIVDAGPDRVVLEGISIRMTPVVKAVEPQYLWSPDIYFNSGANKTLAPVAKNISNDITYTLQVFARGGCMSMDQVYINVLKNPVIPNTFTPNGDNINETWNITYLKDFPDSKVQVFTRAGQKVFESEGYGKPWDGKYKGKPLPFDTYYYIIEPGSGHDSLTGYVTILK